VHFYRRVKPADIDPAKVRAVEETLLFARACLALPAVRIIWFKEIGQAEHDRLRAGEQLSLSIDRLESAVSRGSPGLRVEPTNVIKDEDGFSARCHPLGVDFGDGKGIRPPEIHVVDGPADWVQLCVAHELKHLADFRDGSVTVKSVWSTSGRKTAEQRADEFAETITGLSWEKSRREAVEGKNHG
jgi:hypothetical protein